LVINKPKPNSQWLATTMTTGSKVAKQEQVWHQVKNTTAGLELMEQLSRAAILETVLLTCVGLGLSERM